MTDLVSFPALRCQTVASFLIIRNRVLLIKHKKLNLWLAPGGHVETGELPFQAAEREFWEETGVPVSAIQLNESDLNYPRPVSSQAIPYPVLTNLHWVCQENYQARLASSDLTKPHATQVWPRGCEQHYCDIFLVKPIKKGKIELHLNLAEGTDLRWFDLNDPQTKTLISTDIYQEAKYLCQI